MMASQMYANREVQAQSSASGYAPTQGMDPSEALGAMAQQFMATMDTNKSGTIDKAEFSQAAQALAKSSGKTDTSGVDAAFGKIDTNGDGQISSDEFMSAIKQATAQNDTKKPHHHHHHHHSDASASNSSTPQPDQSGSPTQEAPQMSAMQKNLFNKIMAAYGTSTPTLGTTSNPTA
jgi:G3E family GTPase